MILILSILLITWSSLLSLLYLQTLRVQFAFRKMGLEILEFGFPKSLKAMISKNLRVPCVIRHPSQIGYHDKIQISLKFSQKSFIDTSFFIGKNYNSVNKHKTNDSTVSIKKKILLFLDFKFLGECCSHYSYCFLIIVIAAQYSFLII